MTWTKICGIRTVNEARQVGELGPSAIGLNFYEKSPRCVSPAIAREIGDVIPQAGKKVGVFVDQSPEKILEIAAEVGLDQIQLHGDYQAERLAALQGHSLIWVYRLPGSDLSPLRNAFDELTEYEIPIEAVLIDARVPGQYGGSGHQVDWPGLAAAYDREQLPKLILAGGLRPDNIAEAISIVHPWGVDVASGVERDGRKSVELCRAFLENSQA